MPETKNVTILDTEGFVVTLPFAEGHVCTAAEAKVLNQTRRENLGNNFRTKVKAFQETGTPSLAELQEEFAKLDADYQFTLSNATGTSRKLDPVEREARTIARDYIKQQLAAQSRKITEAPAGVSKEDWDDKVEAEIDRIAATDEVLRMAKDIVKAKSKSAGLQLGELGLGAGAPAEGEATDEADDEVAA